MRSSRAIDDQVHAIAATHFGAVSAREMRDAGIDASMQHRRRRSGMLRPAFTDVFLVGPAAHDPSHDTMCAAAALAAGIDGALSHETAAQRYRFWKRGTDVIHVSSSMEHRQRSELAPVRFHQAADHGLVPLLDIASVPCVPPVRACRQLGESLSSFEVANALSEARFLQLFTLCELEEELASHRGERGVRVVRDALAMYRDGGRGTRSDAEERLRRGMVRAGFPIPVVNTRGITGLTGIEVDFAWHAHRLIVEVDGRQHLESGDLEQDRLRDEAHAALGWHTLRFHARDVHCRLGQVIACIRASLVFPNSTPVVRSENHVVLAR
jgi:very-short-patch-repair endonuclease